MRRLSLLSHHFCSKLRVSTQVKRQLCSVFIRISLGVCKHTLAKASKPRWCPSIVSIPWLFANRRFPSMTKAICCGMGPCLKAPRSNSRTLLMTNSTKGEAMNHFRRWEKCMDVDILADLYEHVGEDYIERCGEWTVQYRSRSRLLSSQADISFSNWSWLFVW